MSRSNNTEVPNPAHRFYRWDGENGGFTYFDKSKGEKGERVKVGLPFRFLVLDILATVRGWNDGEQCGYWSNEVRDIKREPFTVKTKAGVAARGLYDEIMTNRACSGAKFCQSVYIAEWDGVNGLVISNIQMMGAALGAWFDFRKKHPIYDMTCAVESFTEGKKGKTVFQIPVFTAIPTQVEDDNIAKLLDEDLQKYLKVYFSKTREEVATAHVEEKVDPLPTEAPPEADKESLPF